MARKTKEDAAATYHALLDAAEQVFYAKGVSRATLADIAQAAGTTRGAIYWHFKDKGAVFNAMMERATLPLESACGEPDGLAASPLERIQALIDLVLGRLASDAHMRRVFEVALHKVEYVDELRAVRERRLAAITAFRQRLAHELVAAAAERGITLGADAAVAARGLHALLDGLIHSWLLEDCAFDIVNTGRATLSAYLSGLGFAGGAIPACDARVR